MTVATSKGRSGGHRRRSSGRWRWGALAAALVAATLAGCHADAGSTPRTVSAVFADADGLVPGAQVQLADIPVGRVTSVTLWRDRAKVAMVIDAGADVPADVTASIAQTTILGESYVSLAVPRAAQAHPAALASGATISRTSVQPNLEQLVSAGSGVFGAVSDSDLAAIVRAGGQGFTGQAANLHQFLDDLSSISAGYAAHTTDISQVVNSLDQLTSQVAPSAGADATAITNLSQTAAVLAQQSARFNTLLESLNSVSVQGRSLLEQYYPQITDQIRALAAVSSQVAAHQQDLAGLLLELPQHNSTLSSSVRQKFVQVLENIIVCGIPGGGEQSTAPAFTCQPNGSGR